MTQGGLAGWWAAIRYALLGRLFLIAMAVPATRNLLQRHVLPKSGEGPSKEVRESGSYELVQVGEMPDGTILKARVTGQGDPGVRSTTLMLAEAALCLAQDAEKYQSVAASGPRQLQWERCCGTGSPRMPGLRSS